MEKQIEEGKKVKILWSMEQKAKAAEEKKAMPSREKTGKGT